MSTRIGVSACVFPPDPERNLFKGRRLLYSEESMLHWVLKEGTLAYLLPSQPASGLKISDIVSDISGLVLSGGTDIAPETYGEKALKPQWVGDPYRDQYEISLVLECLKQSKPILGVCRGAQILNVAFGGTLMQDINTRFPKALVHRDWDIYEKNFHDVEFVNGSKLAKIYGLKPGQKARINSVHHQAIDKLSEDLKIEALSPTDNIIEAVWHKHAEFVVGVQWHPEFQNPETESDLLSPTAVLKEFIKHAKNN